MLEIAVRFKRGNNPWVMYGVVTFIEFLFLLGRVGDRLLSVFTPFEKLIIFGPACALAALLLIHVPPWILARALRLFSQCRYFVAAYLVLVAAVLTCILLITCPINFVLLRLAFPVWYPLSLGYKMVLVTPPLAYYFGFYLAPALLHLVARIGTKVRGRRRLRR
ncbi:hypothetical protein C8J57DRAFT_47759 [Mycena rebaudengoi]|nr:hypothetical protein C8J57DRAFT_47759 [Mycena rebaudengoi]